MAQGLKTPVLMRDHGHKPVIFKEGGKFILVSGETKEVYIGIWRNKKQGGVVAAFELKEGILVSHKTGIHATVSKDWFYSNFKKEASL